LAKVRHLNKIIDDWKEIFKEGADSIIAERLLKHEHTGRSLPAVRSSFRD